MNIVSSVVMKRITKSFFERKYLVYTLLFLISVITYLKTFWFDFSPLDDVWLIIKNEAILNEWSSALETFKRPISDIYYRPILFVTFIINYKMNGIDPFVFHVTNVIFHGCGVMILFKFLQQYKIESKLAFLFSILFAVHPVLLHSVAWVPGRNDSMLAIFCLSALVFQNKYLEEKNMFHFILIYLFFILAILTKENAIVLPFVFAFNIYVLKGQLKFASLIKILPLFLIIAVWFFVRNSIVKPVPLYDTNIWLNIKNMGLAFFIFIGKTLVPLQHSLYPTILNSSIWPGIISVLVLIVLTYFFGIKNKRLAFFGLFIFIIFLLIPLWFGSTSVNREQYENRLYLPLIGLFVFATQWNINWKKRIARIGLLVLGMTYFLMTFLRMDVYKNYHSYIEYCLEDNPDSYFFHERLADRLMMEKEFMGAIKQYSEAIRLQPNKALFYNNRANAYTSLKNKTAALRDFDSAIVKSNHEPYVYLNRCMTLIEFNEVELAMSELNKLKECCQKMIPPDLEKEINYKWRSLGFTKISEALKKQPNNATLYVNRAKLSYDEGMYKEAVADLEKACALDPQNKNYKEYLGMAKSAGGIK